MNERLNELKEKIKNPKTVIFIGILGIVLIALSSLVTSEKSTDIKTSEFDYEKYQSLLENSISNVVSSISGDKKPTVVVTLQSGIRYSYADDTKTDSNSISNEKSSQSSNKNEKYHITVKTASGDEKPLIITENMPEIRGVAVICDCGEDEIIKQKIQSAIMASLDVTSKRVFITGRN